jgi:hypothetical protein
MWLAFNAPTVGLSALALHLVDGAFHHGLAMGQDVDQFAGFVDHFGQGLSEPAEPFSIASLHV